MKETLTKALVVLSLLIGGCSSNGPNLSDIDDVNKETETTLQSAKNDKEEKALVVEQKADGPELLSTDITAPPKFEKAPKVNDGNVTEAGPVSYQEWLKQQEAQSK